MSNKFMPGDYVRINPDTSITAEYTCPCEHCGLLKGGAVMTVIGRSRRDGAIRCLLPNGDTNEWHQQALVHDKFLTAAARAVAKARVTG